MRHTDFGRNHHFSSNVIRYLLDFFVAEKAVALEAAHKRIGLGDYCLELHSNKTLLSVVMNQFRAAVGRLSTPPASVFSG